MKAVLPAIGITGPDRGGGAAWLFTAAAVRRAGGMPVRITPENPLGSRSIDGLILGGGADVDPVRYGQERVTAPSNSSPHESLLSNPLGLVIYPATLVSRIVAAHFGSNRLDHMRDHLEFSLLELAMKESLPILGICRGHQLMNVFCGGTLHQSLTGLYIEEPEIRSIRPKKQISIVEGTHLHRTLGATTHRVNALHRQGVDRLGDGIIVAARDKNGIIQAIEHAPSAFAIGVQWHPEYLPHKATQQKLFHALVRNAAGHGEV